MTPRRRAILIVILALLLIGVIVAAILLLRRSAPPPVQPPVVEEPAPTPEQQAISAAIQNPLAPAAVEPSGRTAAAQIGELFAERYGSYSTQGDYQNLRDLLPVMTASYRRQTEAMLAKSGAQPAAYEGVTSVKVSTDIRSYNEAAGTAVVAVMLQQEKVTATSSVTGYRSLRMELVRISGEWKVDAARWENELTPAG